MSEYTDAHMTDENGVRWVKVEYANRFFAESRTPPAEGRDQKPVAYVVRKPLVTGSQHLAWAAGYDKSGASDMADGWVFEPLYRAADTAPADTEQPSAAQSRWGEHANDVMYDSAWINGAKFGWNCGLANNNEMLDSAINGRLRDRDELRRELREASEAEQEQPMEEGDISTDETKDPQGYWEKLVPEQPITAQEAREALDILSDEARGIDNGLPEGVGEYERADILQWAEITLGRYIEQTATAAELRYMDGIEHGKRLVQEQTAQDREDAKLLALKNVREMCNGMTGNQIRMALDGWIKAASRQQEQGQG